MSAHEQLYTQIYQDDLPEAEKREIVSLYALKISKLWQYYHDAVGEIATLFRLGELSKNDALNLISAAHDHSNRLLARLLIEQYYNTGDTDMFDRALSLDEGVQLSKVSLVDMKELDSPSGCESGKPHSLVVFFNGMFFDLNSFVAEEESCKRHLKMIIRDEHTVASINRKLNRSRRILEIDEITLGRKYYDGLHLRSHYY